MSESKLVRPAIESDYHMIGLLVECITDMTQDDAVRKAMPMEMYLTVSFLQIAAASRVGMGSDVTGDEATYDKALDQAEALLNVIRKAMSLVKELED